jgi:pimeloyl-ACP methyl ester carboxylesterase
VLELAYRAVSKTAARKGVWVRVPPAVLNPPGDSIVHANGVDLSVETFGDAGDPAILLIHGAGNSLLSWDEELCRRLAVGRFVIRYDLRDSGRSVTYEPGSARYGLDDLAEDAIRLLDALDVERAHMVGMSVGGGIAQLLALDHPEQVASLTLASTTPGGPGPPNPDLPGPTPELMAFFANEPPAPDWSDRDAVADYLVEIERPFAARSRPYDETAMRELAGRVFDRSTNLEWGLANAFLEDSHEPWRERLRSIAVPTLVIHGTEDPVFPYSHAVALADEIPGAELLPMEATGHEYFPPHTWDVVVPAILRHTS